MLFLCDRNNYPHVKEMTTYHYNELLVNCGKSYLFNNFYCGKKVSCIINNKKRKEPVQKRQ